MGRSKFSTFLSCVTVVAAFALASCAVDPHQPQAGSDKPLSDVTIVPITGDALSGKMAYAPNGSVVAVTGHTIGEFNGDSASLVVDPYIAIYDATSGQFLRKIMGKLNPVEINSGGTRLLVVELENDHKLAVYDIQSGNLLFRLDDRNAHFMHDGERLVVQRLEPQHYNTDAFDIRSALSGDVIKTIDVENLPTYLLSITPDDRFIAVRADNYNASYVLLDVETGNISATHAITAPTYSIDASENGDVVALFSYDGERVEFVEATSGTLLSTIDRASAFSGHMDIANDKQTFANMDANGTVVDINLKQISNGSLVRTLASFERPTNMAFSGDARTLAVGFVGGVTIFDVQ